MATTYPKTVEQLDDELASLAIEGYWKTIGTMAREPAPHGEPWLWRWSDVYPKLFAAAETIDLDGGAERRSLRLCTPGLPWKSTTETLTSAIQMVLPGEVARAHRHSQAALRFVIEGSGGYTTVNGERYVMEPGDLILTPQTSWHDHGNLSGGPVVWLDVLDVPFTRNLNAMFFDPYERDVQERVRPDGLGRRLAGPARPAGARSPRTGAHFHYKGAESLPLLGELAADEADPYDGLTLEFVDPYHGGPTLPTIQARLHRLAAGTRTRAHRHTWNAIYHVVAGAGETRAGGKTLAWGPHDTFSLPSWFAHEHRVAPGADAVLFSVTDEPIFRAFALDRMEAASFTEA